MTDVLVVFESAVLAGGVPLAGAESRVLYLSDALIRQGVNVKLLLGDYSNMLARTLPFPVDMTLKPNEIREPNRLVDKIRECAPSTVVVVDSTLVARIARDRTQADDFQLVYEMHDDESVLYRSMDIDNQESIDAQAVALRVADLVVAFTPTDAKSAVQRGAGAVQVIPCGTHISQAAAAARRGTGDIQLVFVGNLFYRPNQQALRFLLENLAPRLEEFNAVLNIVGKAPAQYLNSAAESNRVIYHGPVVDLRRLLSQCDVGLSPLSSGGGMKLKILDYMGVGLAIVGTDEAFTGHAHPSSFARVSGLEDFVRNVRDVCQSAGERRRLGEKALEAAKSLSWEAIATQARFAYGANRKRENGHAKTELASSTPYWYREWLEQGGSVGSLKVPREAEFARQKVLAETGEEMEPSALGGLDGRSSILLSEKSVLKVYLQHAVEHCEREVSALRFLEKSGICAPRVIAQGSVGDATWLLMTRLKGTPLSSFVGEGNRATTSNALGIWLSRLHAVSPKSFPIELHKRNGSDSRWCDSVFTHGDFTVRNAITCDDPRTVAFVDYEKSGRGCRYGDISSFLLFDVVAHRTLPAAPFLDAYKDSSSLDLNADHIVEHMTRLRDWALSWSLRVDPKLHAALDSADSSDWFGLINAGR